VTEQDVINEEMYEEEDDELPGHLRRIAQSLYSNNMWMDRRFESAYLTNIAMRQALIGQGFQNQMSPQYANAPFFAYQHQPQPTAPAQYQSQNVPQSSPTTTGSFRHQPYPMGYRPQAHQRSMSLSAPSEPGPYSSAFSPTTPGADPSEEAKGMPLPSPAIQSPPQMENSTQMRPPASRAGSTTSEVPGAHLQIDTNMNQPLQQPSPQRQSFNCFLGPSYLDPLGQSFIPSPLTAALPPEHQQILGPALSPTDPSTQYLMAGSNQIPQPFTYSYNPNGPPKNRSNLSHGSMTGMDQTLADNALGISTTETTSTPTIFSSISSSEPLGKTDPHWTPSSYSHGSLEDTNPDYYNAAGLDNSFMLGDVGTAGSGTMTPSYGMDLLNFDYDTSPASG
jgi:hypothetical protein